MIRDPGAGPHESPEPQQANKYDRIPYDLGHRPPVAPAGQSTPPSPPSVTAMEVDDSEIPLDMTVRRKNSDRQTEQNLAATSSVTASTVQVPDQQKSPSPPSSISSCCSGDAPINLNTRPSVITKAPPPPIKKRISSMHSNGEIVIKSAVGDNLSPVNCDVFIEEHFRRSLGNTYASIYGNNNNNNNNQQKSSGSDTRNSSTSSSSSISSSSSSSGIGSVASSNSSTSSLMGSNTLNFSVSSHLVGNASPGVARHNHVIPPVDIVPLLKVKAESVLAPVQQQQPQQPPSPVQQNRPAADVDPIKTEPGTVHHVRPDSEEEVDDHFAKALGNDTWKMIQEKKMNL